MPTMFIGCISSLLFLDFVLVTERTRCQQSVTSGRYCGAIGLVA